MASTRSVAVASSSCSVFRGAQRTVFSASSLSSPSTSSHFFSAQEDAPNAARLRAGNRKGNKEGEVYYNSAIRRRLKSTTSTRGFAAKSSGEEEEEEEEEEETTTTSILKREEREEETTTDFAKLDGDSVGKYVKVNKSELPLDQCKAIEREFAFTGANCLLYRKCDEALREVVARHERVHLRGYRGSGKSVSLAILVLRERALGSFSNMGS